MIVFPCRVSARSRSVSARLGGFRALRRFPVSARLGVSGFDEIRQFDGVLFVFAGLGFLFVFHFGVPDSKSITVLVSTATLSASSFVMTSCFVCVLCFGFVPNCERTKRKLHSCTLSIFSRLIPQSSKANRHAFSSVKNCSLFLGCVCTVSMVFGILFSLYSWLRVVSISFGGFRLCTVIRLIRDCFLSRVFLFRSCFYVR